MNLQPHIRAFQQVTVGPYIQELRHAVQGNSSAYEADNQGLQAVQLGNTDRSAPGVRQHMFAITCLHSGLLQLIFAGRGGKSKKNAAAEGCWDWEASRRLILLAFQDALSLDLKALYRDLPATEQLVNLTMDVVSTAASFTGNTIGTSFMLGASTLPRLLSITP